MSVRQQETKIRDGIPAPRNAICPRSGLRESRRESMRIHTYSSACVCACVGAENFFWRPLEDQAPFIKCSLENEEGVGRASARCQNFQQFFIPLFGETNENEVGLLQP